MGSTERHLIERTLMLVGQNTPLMSWRPRRMKIEKHGVGMFLLEDLDYSDGDSLALII